MRAASKTKSTKRKAAKKVTTKKTTAKTKSVKKKPSAKKSSRKKAKTAKKRGAATKDPKGGLTAAGRRAFARKDGAHLKPGVRKRASDMTPTEMRRKGSWAVRFYGRTKLSPLIGADGQPTRYALSAHAWGEPVPKTIAAARRIARKGERLLARYRRLKTK